VGALPPAAEVATLLKARGLPVAERVEYVYIVGDPTSKASTKVDAPDYIRDNKLSVDTKYYMTNQFRKPILELLGPALENLEHLIDKYTDVLSNEVKEDEQAARRTAHQKELHTIPITSFFKPKL
jgi:DNA polymerase elongation subunit (family B)